MAVRQAAARAHGASTASRPYSHPGPAVAGWMIVRVIYLVCPYRAGPGRAAGAGLVHLDPLEECE